MTRPCEIKKSVKIEAPNGFRYETFWEAATFHGFGNDYHEDYESDFDGDRRRLVRIPVSVAIVERVDGTISMINPTEIRMTDLRREEKAS